MMAQICLKTEPGWNICEGVTTHAQSLPSCQGFI